MSINNTGNPESISISELKNQRDGVLKLVDGIAVPIISGEEGESHQVRYFISPNAINTGSIKAFDAEGNEIPFTRINNHIPLNEISYFRIDGKT